MIDPVHDVYALLWNADGSHLVFSRRPHVRNGDITSAVVRHRSAAVHVTVRLAKLRPPTSNAYTDVSLRTAHDTWHTTLSSHSADPTPEITLLHKGGSKWSCPRVRARIDYAADVIRVRVPRRCMGNPAWVQPRVTMTIAPRNEAEDMLIDSAPGNKPREWEQFGAKVRHAGR